MAVRDKTGIAGQLTSLLPDNTAGDISAQDVRNVFTDLIDSLAFLTDIQPNVVTARSFANVTDAIISRFSSSTVWILASNQQAGDNGSYATTMVRDLSGGKVTAQNGSVPNNVALSTVLLRAGTVCRVFSRTDIRIVGQLVPSPGSIALADLASAVQARLLPTLPATGDRDDKVAKFNGDTLGWEADAGGGGTGDITEVTTGTNSGLAGGVTTGAASLSLDVDNLEAITALQATDAIPVMDDSDSGDATKKITLGSLLTQLAGDNITYDATDVALDGAASGGGGGDITSVGVTAPITGGGAAGAVTIGISAATTSAAGSMSGADKTKLDGVEASATADQTGAEIVTLLEALTGSNRLDASTALRNQRAITASSSAATGGREGDVHLRYSGSNLTHVEIRGSSAWTSYSVPSGGTGGATNLSITNRDGDSLDVASSTGTDATIAAATVSLAGLMSAADKTKLDGLSSAPGSHQRRIAISTDTTLDLTEIQAGNDSTSQDLTVPTFTSGTRYIFIGVPTTEPNITDILQSGISVFGAWQAVAGTISNHKWWRTTTAQNTLASGIVYSIREA